MPLSPSLFSEKSTLRILLQFLKDSKNNSHSFNAPGTPISKSFPCKSSPSKVSAQANTIRARICNEPIDREHLERFNSSSLTASCLIAESRPSNHISPASTQPLSSRE